MSPDATDPLAAFRAKVEAFLVQHRLPPSRFGRLSCNDSAFVITLRQGRELKLSTIRKVEAWMQTYTPPEASAARTGTTG